MSATESAGGLLGATEIRSLAAELSLVPTKKLGQNFVHDANTVRKIVAKAGVQPGERVLEVGPGLGSLTLGLLEAGADVVAVEIDGRLAELLPKTAARLQPGKPLQVIHADALATTEIPTDVSVIVANLPYNTSVPIVLHLLASLPSLTRVLVMVQAEVAERLAAGPGSKAYGGPSVKAAWYGTWSIAGSVSRQVFWPVPNVDSLLVAMDARPAPGDEELRQVVWDLVDHAFATRRKMSRGSLASYLGSDRVSEIITAAGLNPEDRGEAWSLEGYVSLAKTWLAMK
jgi:16S rRNA (adenine1518-N6/adenine1519-N6)-dimethyltransferase